MAELTRATSKHISQTLLSSYDTDEPQYLYGNVPSDTYNSLKRLSMFLGLETEAAAKKWFESEQFKPIFDALYYKVIEPRMLGSPAKQGPKLSAVQTAIIMGEGHGGRKYTGWKIDERGFDDIDHYALCLIRLREENRHSHGGIFRGKQMTDEQIEVRLWHAIMRETSQRSELRKRISGEGEGSKQSDKKQKKRDPKSMPPADMEQQMRPLVVRQRTKDTIAADQHPEPDNPVDPQQELAAATAGSGEAFIRMPPIAVADNDREGTD
jgi:hypothetical protein